MSSTEPSSRPSTSSGPSTTFTPAALGAPPASSSLTALPISSSLTSLASRPAARPDGRARASHSPTPAPPGPAELVPVPGSIILLLPPPAFLEAAAEQWGEGEFPADRRLRAETFAARPGEVVAAEEAGRELVEKSDGKERSASPGKPDHEQEQTEAGPSSPRSRAGSASMHPVSSNDEQQGRKRKSMELDDEPEGNARDGPGPAKEQGDAADPGAIKAVSGETDEDVSAPTSVAAKQDTGDVSMEDGEIEEVPQPTPPDETKAAASRRGSPADIVMSVEKKGTPKPDPPQVGPNGLPILTRRHYHPKVIALARKLAAQRGIKLVVDEDLIERMRHRKSPRSTEDSGSKRTKLESEVDVGPEATSTTANGSAASEATGGVNDNANTIDGALQQSLTVPTGPEVDPPQADALQRLKNEVNGDSTEALPESAPDSPMVSTPATPALPLTNKLLFGATGTPSAQSTPPPASPRVGSGVSHKKKGGRKEAKSHKAKVHILDQSASALERERDERERAALPPGMSIALDGTLKSTEDVLYERKARDTTKGIGSTSWWNHLLIDARKQRGPQWDINTNMYQVDRLSAFYYQSTAPPPKTPSPQAAVEPLPEPSDAPESLVHSMHATPADRAVPLPGPPSEAFANAAAEPQRRQSFAHSASPFHQTPAAGPGLRRPSVVMPHMMGQAGSPGRPVDAPSPHGTIAGSQASPHSVSAVPTAGSPYGSAMAGLPPAIAASLTPQQVQQVMRNQQQQRSMQAAMAAAVGHGQPPAGQTQQQQQQQHYAGSPPGAGASPTSAGQTSMMPNGAGPAASHADLTPQQIQQQAILRQYAMAQSNAFGNARPGAPGGMQAPGQPNAALLAMLAQAQQIGGHVDARTVQALQARMAAAQQQGQQQQQQQTSPHQQANQLQQQLPHQQSLTSYGIPPTGFNPGSMQGGMGMNPSQLMMMAAAQQAQQQQR